MRVITVLFFFPVWLPIVLTNGSSAFWGQSVAISCVLDPQCLQQHSSTQCLPFGKYIPALSEVVLSSIPRGLLHCDYAVSSVFHINICLNYTSEWQPWMSCTTHIPAWLLLHMPPPSGKYSILLLMCLNIDPWLPSHRRQNRRTHRSRQAWKHNTCTSLFDSLVYYKC